MATVYIAPTAQGSADGTSEANAYAIGSLSTAQTQAQVGGTIYFLDGDYYTSGNFSFTSTGINYQSLNKHGARLGPPANSSTTPATFTIGTSSTTNISVKDFKIRHCKMYMHSSTDATAPTVIQGNLIYTDEAKDFANNGAFWIAGANYAVSIFDNVYRLIQGGRAADTMARNMSANVKVERNTVYFDAPATTTMDTSSLSSAGSLKNNIFVGTGGATFSNTFSANATNCCIYNFGAGNDGSSNVGTNNKFEDPLLVDAVNLDLRLRPSSPCINAGVA